MGVRVAAPDVRVHRQGRGYGTVPRTEGTFISMA